MQADQVTSDKILEGKSVSLRALLVLESLLLSGTSCRG